MARKKLPVEPLLNPEQQRVADHRSGPLRVGAVAGSGKTTALVERVVRLVRDDNIDPNRILMISFSRIAREQMQRRIDKRLPGHNAGKCARTFHSIGLDVFRSETGSKKMIDTSGLLYTKAINSAYRRKHWKPQKAVTKAFASVVKNDLLGTTDVLRRLGKTDPRMYLLAERLSRGKGIGPAELIDAFYLTEDIRCREGVDHDGGRHTFVTFDDMVYEAAMLLKRTDVRERWADRWLYILQDEAQDECEAQGVIADALASKHKNYMIVGDPAQAVYGWRGAHPRRMLAFEEHYPGAQTVVMFRNYRSGVEIVDLANRLVDHMPADTVIADDFGEITPMSSERKTHAFVGYHIFNTAEEEASAIADNILTHKEQGFDWKHQAVLVRMNRMTRAIEMALVRRKVPFKLHSGNSFFALRETRVMLSYLRVIAKRAGPEAFTTALMNPSRKLGRAFADSVVDIGAADDDWLPALEQVAKTAPAYQATAALHFVESLRDFRPPHKLPAEPEAWLESIRHTFELDDWLTGEVGESEDSDATSNLDEVLAFGRQFDTVAALLDALDEIDAHRASLKGLRNTVQVSTIHKQKGAEYKVVYALQVGGPFFPASNSDLAEERRLFYVAITRAMDELWISRPQASGRIDEDGNEVPMHESLFVREVGLKPLPTYVPGRAIDPTPVGTQIGLEL